MKKVGLFFGSFNPIHIGHLALANYMLEFESLDEVWFVVSPQNPFKKAADLLDAETRIEMVKLATEQHERYRAEDIELTLPKPSYTINTLAALGSKYPQHSFSLIMGGDNILRFEQWKSAEEIMTNHQILVYPRPGYKVSDKLPVNCRLTHAPVIEMASSDIRQWIKKGKETPFLIPEKVFDYIKKNGLYL